VAKIVKAKSLHIHPLSHPNMTGDGENKRLLGLFSAPMHRDEKERQVGKSTPIFWGGIDTKIDR
jgi:hypothetical protein